MKETGDVVFVLNEKEHPVFIRMGSDLKATLNITLEESLASLLEQQAKHEHRPVASIAKELILEALERREDIALSAIAQIRDVKKAKRIKHENVWK